VCVCVCVCVRRVSRALKGALHESATSTDTPLYV